MDNGLLKINEAQIRGVVYSLSGFAGTASSVSADISSALSCLSFSVSSAGVTGAIQTLSSDYTTLASAIVSSLNEYNNLNDSLDSYLIKSTDEDLDLDQILAMGKGPLSAELIKSNPALYQEYLEAAQKNYTRESLTKYGFTEKDINRVLNGELTAQELYQEICREYADNGDDSRFKKCVEAVQLSNYYYSEETLKKELDDTQKMLRLVKSDDLSSEILTESSMMDDIISNAQKQSDGSYKYSKNGKEIVFSEEEFKVYKESKKTLDTYLEQKSTQEEVLSKRINDLQTEIDNPSRAEFKYQSMEELDAGILDVDKRIKNIEAQKAALKDGMYDKEYDELPTQEETKSKLEDKKINDWFGLRNDSLEGTGWSCIKLNNGKYSVMNGAKDKYQTYNSEEELIAAGFYVAPDHRFSVEKYDVIKTDLKSLEEEKAKLENEKLQLEAIKASVNNVTEKTLKYGKYLYKSDFEENCGYNFKEDMEIIYNGRSAISNQYESVPYSYLGALYSGVINHGFTNTSIFGNNNNGMLYINCEDERFNGDTTMFQDNLTYPMIMLDVTNNSLMMDRLDNVMNWTSVIDNDEEGTVRKIFNYICNTDPEGYKAGYDFIKSEADSLDFAWVEGKQKEQAAEVHKTWYSPALAVTKALIYTPFESMRNSARLVRKTFAGEKTYGSDTYVSGETYYNEVLGMWKEAGPVGEKFFSTLYSVDQVLISMAASKGLGGGTAVNTAVSAFLYGGQTVNDTFRDAKNRNISDANALCYATFCGLSHTLAKSFSLTKITGLEAQANNLFQSGEVMSTVKSMVSNLPEKYQDVASKILVSSYLAHTQGLASAGAAGTNVALRNAADIIINGASSNYSLQVKNYKKTHKNCSDSEAYLAVTRDLYMKMINASGNAYLVSFIAAESVILPTIKLPSENKVNFDEAFEPDKKPPQEEAIGSIGKPAGDLPGGPGVSLNRGNGSEDKGPSNNPSGGIKDSGSSGGTEWITVRAKNNAELDEDLDDFGSNGNNAFAAAKHQMDNDNVDVAIPGAENNESSSVGQIVQQTEMMVDAATGNVVQRVQNLFVSEGGQTNVNSIQEGYLQSPEVSADTTETDTGLDLTDSVGVKVPVDGKQTDTFTGIEDKGSQNDIFVSPKLTVDEPGVKVGFNNSNNSTILGPKDLTGKLPDTMTQTENTGNGLLQNSRLPGSFVPKFDMTKVKTKTEESKEQESIAAIGDTIGAASVTSSIAAIKNAANLVDLSKIDSLGNKTIEDTSNKTEEDNKQAAIGAAIENSVRSVAALADDVKVGQLGNNPGDSSTGTGNKKGTFMSSIGSKIKGAFASLRKPKITEDETKIDTPKVVENDSLATERQEKVSEEMKKFDLGEFLKGNGASTGGIGLITPKQTIVTDNFVRQKYDPTYGDHGKNTDYIYKTIYGEDATSKPNEDELFQESVMNDGNVLIQFCSDAPSIVWIPDKINPYQQESLIKLNKQIKSIYESDPQYFDEHPMEFEVGNLEENYICVNNLDECIEKIQIKVDKNHGSSKEEKIIETKDISEEPFIGSVELATGVINGAKTIMDSQIQSSEKDVPKTNENKEIIEQIENELKDLSIESMVDSMKSVSDEEYSAFKTQVFDTIYNSDSDVRTDIIASFIPAAIKNGDLELLDKLRTELSNEEITKIKSTLDPVDPTLSVLFDKYGINGLDKEGIEAKVKDKSVNELIEEMQKLPDNSDEVKIRTLEAKTLIETDSEEKIKVISSLISFLPKDEISTIKSMLSIDDRMKVRRTLEEVDFDSSKLFASINSQQDVVDLLNKTILFPKVKEDFGDYTYEDYYFTDVIEAHAKNIVELSVEGTQRYIDFITHHSKFLTGNFASYSESIKDFSNEKIISNIETLDKSFFEDENYDLLINLNLYRTVDGSYMYRGLKVLGKSIDENIANIKTLDSDLQERYMIAIDRTLSNKFKDLSETLLIFARDMNGMDDKALERYLKFVEESSSKGLFEHSIPYSIDKEFFNSDSYDMFNQLFGVLYKKDTGELISSYDNRIIEIKDIPESILKQHAEIFDTLDEKTQNVYRYVLDEMFVVLGDKNINDVLSSHANNLQGLDEEATNKYLSLLFNNMRNMPDIIDSIDMSYFNDEEYDKLKEDFGVLLKDKNGDFRVGTSFEAVSSESIKKHEEIVSSLDDQTKEKYMELFNVNSNFRNLIGEFEYFKYLDINNGEITQKLLESAFNHDEIINYIYSGMKENVNNAFDEQVSANISKIQNTCLGLSLNYGTITTIAKFLGSKIDSLSDELIKDVIDATINVNNSNSLEMQNFTSQILDLAFQTEDPFTAIDKIKNIFEKNNLPIIGKIFKCFELLHPDFSNFNSSDLTMISPILQESGNLRRKSTVFNDLIKAVFGSNNKSVNGYLENIEFGQKIFEKINNNTFDADSLTDTEKGELETFRNHLITMYENTLKGRYDESVFQKSDDITEDINKLAQLISPDGTLNYNLGDRLVNMFCGLAGIKTLDEAIGYVKTKISTAEQRNIEASRSDMALEEGDLIKGIGDITYLGAILQNGSVAKEYLGASAGSDSTPLDTDLSMVMGGDTIKEKVEKTAANSYGPIYFVLKNDSRFETTRTKDGETDVEHDPSKLELFYTGVLGDGHYGIRTGFASSDINYILTENYDPRIGLEIAKNGFYIPVSNMDGKIVFTYEDYTDLREKMSGLSYYDNDEFNLSSNLLSEKILETQTRVTEGISKTQEDVSLISSQIKDALISSGIKNIFDGFSSDLSGNSAELYSTGSTSRGTNVPGDSDFDYLIKIDREVFYDEQKLNELKATLAKKLGLTYGPGGKLVGDITTDDNQTLEVEISICPRTDKIDFSTDVALADKLNAIKEQNPEYFETVLANIVTAKEILKEAGAYKSAKSGTGEGGLGGIGIENWILQNGGSLHDAAISFLKVADSCDTFEEFTNKYQVFDLGSNHYSGNKGVYPHDNFVFGVDDYGNLLKMTKEGYEKTIEALRKYLENEHIINQDNDEFVQVIDVSKISTERSDTDVISKGADSNVFNMSYKGYDLVFKSNGDDKKTIDKAIKSSNGKKVIIEISDTRVLDQETIDKLPENVDVRVLGGYGFEQFKGFKTNDAALTSLQKATYSKEELKAIVKELDDFESGIDPSWDDTTKARYAYNYIVKNIKYNPSPEGRNIGRHKRYDSLVSLIDKESTCQGFAHTYQELMTRMGLESYEISGRLVGGHEQHAFNVIHVDGKYMIVDTTKESLREPFYGYGFGVSDPENYHFSSYKGLKEEVLKSFNTSDENGNDSKLESSGHIISNFIEQSGLISSNMMLKIALRKGLNKVSQYITENDNRKQNITTVLKSLDLDYIKKDLIKQYDTKFGFNFGEFLNHCLLNNMLSNNDIETLDGLSDVQEIKNNPTEMLHKIREVLNNINHLVDEYSPEVLDATNYSYLSFLSYYVSRDASFRIANEKLMGHISRLLADIGTKVMESKKNSTIDYHGVKITTYGDDSEFLKEALGRTLTVIDKLPEPLLKQSQKVSDFRIYDTVSPDNLEALYSNDALLRNPNKTAFYSAGNYTSYIDKICLFKNSFYSDDKTLLNKISHELGHRMDHTIINSDSFFTVNTALWREAIEKDGNSVSSYGDTKTCEDFAEMCGLYSLALAGYIDLEELKMMYPERMKLLEMIFEIEMYDGSDKSRLTVLRKLEILGTFDKFMENNPTLMKKLFGDELNWFYNNQSFKEKIKLSLLMAKYKISNQFGDDFINDIIFSDDYDGELFFKLYKSFDGQKKPQDYMLIWFNYTDDIGKLYDELSTITTSNRNEEKALQDIKNCVINLSNDGRPLINVLIYYKDNMKQENISSEFFDNVLRIVFNNYNYNNLDGGYDD